MATSGSGLGDAAICQAEGQAVDPPQLSLGVEKLGSEECVFNVFFLFLWVVKEPPFLAASPFQGLALLFQD